MAKELPYLPTYKNVEELFRKIAAAKQPEAFTTRFLSDTLGLKGTGDRALISLLKALGFLDQSGRPTPAYGALKNPSEARRALAQAIRSAYGPLFAANENAHTLGASEIRGLIAQVAGSDAGMTTKIAGTFNALTKLGDFSSPPVEGDKDGEHEEQEEPEEQPQKPPQGGGTRFGALRPEFHYNIQVHLPANATEETYMHIFNAMRKAFR